MCTVTYLPYQHGFILTHNRDEAPARSPQTITRESNGKDHLIFPRDTKAGGAWIVSARSGKTACLLNGAFVKHKHEPPYRRSRGLIMLDFFEWTDPDGFFTDYPLDGVEPFTFLLFQRHHVTEFRWDGTVRYLKRLDPGEPLFWCSATLYPPDMQVMRAQVFQHWLNQSNIHRLENDPHLAAAAYKLHLTGSVGDPEYDYRMNRGGRVMTVSITQIIQKQGLVRMRYSDLLEGHEDRRKLNIVL
jgi:hypothetical protein